MSRTSSLFCYFPMLIKRGVTTHELPTQLQQTFVAGGVIAASGCARATAGAARRQACKPREARHHTLRTAGVKTLESSSACRMSSWEAVMCVDCSLPFLSRWLNVMPRWTCSMSLPMQSLQPQGACEVLPAASSVCSSAFRVSVQRC